MGTKSDTKDSSRIADERRAALMVTGCAKERSGLEVDGHRRRCSKYHLTLNGSLEGIFTKTR
jgi:hypothetical protein